MSDSVIGALQALYTSGTRGKASSSSLDTLEASAYGVVAAAFLFFISTLLRCFVDGDGVVGAANQNPDQNNAAQVPTNQIQADQNPQPLPPPLPQPPQNPIIAPNSADRSISEEDVEDGLSSIKEEENHQHIN